MTERRDTDAFAEALARDLRPVRPLLALPAALATVAAAAAVSLAALGGPSWLRSDAGPAMVGIARFAAVGAGLATLAVAGLAAGLVAREPGRRSGATAAVAVLGAALGPAALVGAVLLGHGFVAEPPAAQDLACGLHGLLRALLPGLVAFGLLARGAPAHPRAAAVLVGAGAVAFGATCQHLACGADGIRHVLVSHAGVPALGALPGLALGAWWRARRTRPAGVPGV